MTGRMRLTNVLALVGLLCALSMATSAGPAADKAEAASCANQYYNTLGADWPTNTTDPYYTMLDVNWPGGATGRSQILQGHLNWNYTVNSCGQSDVSPFASWWGGGTSGWNAGTQDGVSYRDFGPLVSIGCTASALACAPYWADPGTSDITETDQRYNGAYGYSWYYGVGSIGSGQYDMQSVASHESGHSLGLNHVAFTPILVMYPSIAAGTTSQRALGWGDYTGMQTLYP